MPDPKDPKRDAQKPAPSPATIAGDGDTKGGDVDKGYADRPARKGGNER